MLASLAIATLLLAPPPTDARATPRQDTACHAYLPRGLTNGPTFTPYDRAPELLNRDSVRRALDWLYPLELKAAGTGGQTLVWALIDACGRVVRVQLKASSARALLDSAALKVAGLMRFSPALDRSGPVNVWVQLPIVFGAGPHPAPLPVPPRAFPLERGDLLPRFPAPPGYVGPSLLNAGEIQTRLLEGYARSGASPASLVLALRIDERGRVSDAAIATSSGSAALDSLALAVARRMAFLPAVDPRRRYCSISTSVPIQFGTRTPLR